MANSALLVLDVQNDIFVPENPNLSAFETALLVINEAIGLFRNEALPIALIQHASSKKPEGSESWMVYRGLNSTDSDFRLSKPFLDAFWQTELDSHLRSSAVKDLIVCGFLSEHCVLSTYRGAIQRGFKAQVLEGGVASLSDDMTEFTLRLCEHVSINRLAQLFAKGESGAR